MVACRRGRAGDCRELRGARGVELALEAGVVLEERRRIASNDDARGSPIARATSA